MTSRVYKSAQGKSVDMGRLALQNEKTRAVGNMKVNARGDVVNDSNKIIAKKNEQVNRQYNKQVTSTNRGPQ